ncbi:MAG TPA: hypothetical protein VD996_07390 [Chitinophagaceae bacterium]|nr:hypothetical protein [Chitinophagaceae bacterium]
MKFVKYISAAVCLSAFILSSCEKRSYPDGLPEYEHHYYAAYIPNNNSQVSVNRSQAALLKFPVQFYSSFTRDYDAVAHYAVVTTGIANPAVLGQDFNIVDKNGQVLQPVDGKYSMVFPQAKRMMDTIYVKLLNSTVPGTRKMEIQIQENKTDKFYVDIFSTAFRRPVEIK